MIKEFNFLRARNSEPILMVFLLGASVILQVVFLIGSGLQEPLSNFHFMFMIWVCCHVIPTFFITDTPISTNTWCLTRPLSQSKLFVVKFLLIASVVTIPSLVGYAIFFARIGSSWFMISRAVLSEVLDYLFAITPLILIASCSQKKSEYFALTVSLALVYLAMYLGFKQFTNFPLRAFYSAPTFVDAQKVDSLQSLLSSLETFLLVIGTTLSAYLLHRRVQRRVLALIIAATALGVIGPKVYGAVEAQKLINELKQPVQQALEIEDGYAMLHTDPISQQKNPDSLSFLLTPKSSNVLHVPHLLRFKELEITDSNGVEFKVLLTNRGIVPCLQTSLLKNYLASQGEHDVTFPDSSDGDCTLGEEVILPHDAVFSGDVIPRIRGSLYGLNINLVEDYRIAIGKNFSGSTPPFPIGAFVGKPYRFRPFSLNEIAFAPPLFGQAVDPISESSALYAHWFASPRTYLLFNRETNTGVRLPSDAVPLNNTSLGIAFSEPYISFASPHAVVSNDRAEYNVFENSQRLKLTKKFLEGSSLYRIFPRIEGGFVSAIDMKNIPLKRLKRKLSEEKI